MTDPRLSQIEERVAKATPGPWRRDGCYIVRDISGEDFEGWENVLSLGNSLACQKQSIRNLEFVANSREAIPYLLSKVKELEAERDRLPANWCQDSSLETWFPITAEEIVRLKSQLAAAEELATAVEGLTTRLEIILYGLSDTSSSIVDLRLANDEQIKSARAALAKFRSVK